MNYKQAERLLKQYYGEIDLEEGRINNLCDNLPYELQDDFKKYWKKINTERKMYIWMYLPLTGSFDDIFMSNMVRLLTAFIFIRDTYE